MLVINSAFSDVNWVRKLLIKFFGSEYPTANIWDGETLPFTTEVAVDSVYFGVK